MIPEAAPLALDSRCINAATEILRLLLASAETRHHVGNLLAPHLLARGLPEPLCTKVEKGLTDHLDLRRALLSVVDAAGLAASTTGTVRAKWTVGENGLLEEILEDTDPFNQKKNIRFLLLDDQYKLGYHHLLATLLLGSKYRPNEEKDRWTTSFSWEIEGEISTGALTCIDKVDSILEKLTDEGRVSDWKQPRQLDLGYEILLLDLRLWTSEGQKIAFLRGVVATCDVLGADSLGEHDPLFRRALDSARQVLKGDVHSVDSADKSDPSTAPSQREDPAGELDSLALFPLLLSYYDPSLPIIIFSSTQQRSVVELLSHRANIQTGFSKPVLSGYQRERPVALFMSDLIHVIREAIDLHEARALWQRLPSAQWTTQLIFQVTDPDPPPEPGPIRRIRIEKQRPNITLEALRRELAALYIEYIQGRRYRDFAAEPYAFLERYYTPLDVIKNTTNPGFSITDDNTDHPLLDILEISRHKKAHGRLPSPTTEEDEERYRLAALFLFHCFIDHVTGARTDPALACEILGICSCTSVLAEQAERIGHLVGNSTADEFIRKRAQQLIAAKLRKRLGLKGDLIDPKKVVIDDTFDWLYLVIHAGTHMLANRSVFPKHLSFSPTSLTALLRLQSYLWNVQSDDHQMASQYHSELVLAVRSASLDYETICEAVRRAFSVGKKKLRKVIHQDVWIFIIPGDKHKMGDHPPQEILIDGERFGVIKLTSPLADA